MQGLFYGSYYNQSDPSWVDKVLEVFIGDDFVILWYRWHATKDAHASKLQEAINDVSRLRIDSCGGRMENIHIPLKYYCRKDPHRYAVSCFKVVSMYYLVIVAGLLYSIY